MQPWFDEREAEAVSAYMRSGGWLTEHEQTRQFARMIAEYTGARFCSIVSNGTVSLTAALLALGVSTGDEVIVPAYTMVASANAVLLTQGARPIFADVEPETMCLDVECVRAAISDRTRALMLVSINGRYPRQLDDLLALCREREIPIIEDAAQSLGSFHAGRHVGRHGLVGSFSFSMPKIITTGQGGALITDDEAVFKKIELVRNFGREQAGIDRHVFLGLNFKFTDLQAVVGIEQMKKVPDRVLRKRRIYQELKSRLADVPGMTFFAQPAETTPWFNDVLVDDREALAQHLKGRGIGTRPFYPSVPTQAPYDQAGDRFPVAAHLAQHGLWLPSAAQLTDADVSRIVDAIREHLGVGRAT
jgi:perosamine synthetase